LPPAGAPFEEGAAAQFPLAVKAAPVQQQRFIIVGFL
jgi:hypothetical protein